MPGHEKGWEGIAADLDEAAAEVLAPAPVQLTLLDALEARGVRPIATMGAVVPAPDDDAEGEPATNGPSGRKGLGRPPGALNRSTEALRSYIFANYGNPLLNAARIASADPVELARYLKCEPKEALVLVLKAIQVVSEYVNSKMPSTVRLDGKGALAFGMFTGDNRPEGGETSVAERHPLSALLAYSEQYQGLSDGPESQSSSAKSSDPAKGEP